MKIAAAFALVLFVHGVVSSSAGCCCCTGMCLYSSGPECPCPAPPPGKAQPTCALQSAVDRYGQQYTKVLANLASPTDYPTKTQQGKDGTWGWQTSTGWTSGFFPGILWQLGNYTKNSTFSAAAAKFTAGRAGEATDTSTHDVGFMVFGSFGNGVELAAPGTIDSEHYKSIIIQTAHSLAVRYSPVVGMTRSWGANSDQKSFEVIIDNLMNLELMFWAAKNGGPAESKLHDMALSHAKKTAAYWVRPDGSTPHLCIFSPTTGKLISPCTGTPQGYSANSTWARGQAWAIYGFTLAYRFTQDPALLTAARAVAAYWLDTVPSGGVPNWDFEAPSPTYADTSAAAIVASAFVELSTFTKDPKYAAEATAIVNTLTTNPAFVASTASTDAVTKGNGHDCGSADCTIIEPEYYLLEAIRRLQPVA